MPGYPKPQYEVDIYAALAKRQKDADERVIAILDSENSADGFLLKAKRIVSEVSAYPQDKLFIVWFTKTLQYWKAMVGTTDGNDVYFEVTYNGDKREAYVDFYMKHNNIRVPDLVYPPTGN